jgi:hypothetical protein
MMQHPTQRLINWQVGFSPGRNDPSASAVEQARAASAVLTPYAWFQQVSTTRLNAVSVSYTMPPRLARRLGAERLTLSLQGSNLGLWSNYRGLDPNVNGFVTGNRLEDSGALPQPRTWQVHVRAVY